MISSFQCSKILHKISHSETASDIMNLILLDDINHNYDLKALFLMDGASIGYIVAISASINPVSFPVTHVQSNPLLAFS